MTMTGEGRLVFVDTSALYALADENDRHHAEAKRTAERIKKLGVLAFTTNYIVAETHVLLLSRLGADAARTWLDRFVLKVEQVSEKDQAHARNLVLTHDDKDYSLTDASSFSIMRRLGTHIAFAFDAHFRQFGFEIIA